MEKKISLVFSTVNATDEAKIPAVLKSAMFKPYHIQLELWHYLENLSWLGIRSLDDSISNSTSFVDHSTDLVNNLNSMKDLKSDVEMNNDSFFHLLSTQMNDFMSRFQSAIINVRLTMREIQDILGKKPSNNSTVPEDSFNTGSKLVDNILENVSDIADKIEQRRENTFKNVESLNSAQLETVLKVADAGDSENGTKFLVDVDNNKYVLMKPHDLTKVYEDSQLLLEIIVLIGSSFVVGFLFELIGLPSFFGFIVVGILMGPLGIDFIQV